ncbi:Hypothetical predicted protein, partial [Paramuricea clavata]
MVRVAYNGNLSQESYSFIGVPQASILGPLLFVIAFNDIDDVIKESSIIMYTDDVVLYVAADDIKAISWKLSNDMRNDMESIADWMDENEFIINLKEVFLSDPNFPSAVELKKKRACVLVRKIMGGDICDPLSGHFIRNEHGR